MASGASPRQFRMRFIFRSGGSILQRSLAFFAILYAWFDRSLWKLSLSHRLGLVRVPDLNGTWAAEVKSQHDDDTTHTTTVSIDQTWTEICIGLQSEHSRSDSVVAAILFPKPGEIVLTYQYNNEPSAHAATTMHAHRGTAWLCLRSERRIDHLEGDYYSGRDRQNIGHIRLTRLAEAKSQAATGAR